MNSKHLKENEVLLRKDQGVEGKGPLIYRYDWENDIWEKIK